MLADFTSQQAGGPVFMLLAMLVAVSRAGGISKVSSSAVIFSLVGPGTALEQRDHAGLHGPMQAAQHNAMNDAHRSVTAWDGGSVRHAGGLGAGPI